jgi:hypothetical protein
MTGATHSHRDLGRNLASLLSSSDVS